jgi:hypothetical protein
MNNKMFFFFLLVAGISFALANEQLGVQDMPKTDVPSEGEYVYLVELDSVDIYKELIAQEDKESSCAMDIVGIVVGGSITGFGAFLVGTGLYAIFSNSNSQSMDDAFDQLGGALAILASVPVLLIGIPVMIVNIGDYKVHKKHAMKRDEYQEALDRYKVRMQEEGWKSVQFMVVPTLNLAKASFGANAVLQF